MGRLFLPRSIKNIKSQFCSKGYVWYEKCNTLNSVRSAGVTRVALHGANGRWLNSYYLQAGIPSASPAGVEQAVG